MSSEFYRIYNLIISKSLKKPIKEEINTTDSIGIGSRGDYAPGDARVPKALSKKPFRRQEIKGLIKPKEVK